MENKKGSERKKRKKVHYKTVFPYFCCLTVVFGVCVNVCYLSYRWIMTKNHRTMDIFESLVRGCWSCMYWSCECLSVNMFGIVYEEGKFSTCYAHCENSFVFYSFPLFPHFLLLLRCAIGIRKPNYYINSRYSNTYSSMYIYRPNLRVVVMLEHAAFPN